MTKKKGILRQLDNEGPQSELATAVRACAEMAIDRPVTIDPLSYQTVLLQDDRVTAFREEIRWYLRRNRLKDFSNRVTLLELNDYLRKHLRSTLLVCVASNSQASNTTIHAIKPA